MRLLQRELFVEILDEAGRRRGLGQRGEIVVSGGIDPALPLLRYRTGDYASLTLDAAGELCLDGLEGRPPVVFTAADGAPVNNIDVTHALSPFALPQFALHQAADGSFTLRAAGAYDENALRRALEAVLGASARIDVAQLVDEGKVRQYTREQQKPVGD
jgi:phenylacetate-CoA ligase